VGLKAILGGNGFEDFDDCLNGARLLQLASQ